MKKVLIENSKSLINEFHSLLQRESLGYQHIGQLNGIAFLVNDILQNIEILVRERVVLERILLKISDHLLDASHLHFYASLYELPQTVYANNIQDVQKLLIKINLDISTMRVRIIASKIANFNST